MQKTVGLVILLVLTFAIQAPIVNSALSVQVNLTNSGSIIFNPEPTEPSGGALPNSIIGEDYLLYYVNSDPSVWTSSQMNKFTQWECNTARLGFAFQDASPAPFQHSHSDYVEWKMDAVINIFDNYGIKVILDNHNVGDHSHYLGSQAWVDNWKAIAQHYKGNQRIAGFNIFNEPTSSTWATSGPLGNINTKEKFLQACKYCIDQIRAIDPTRTIFFPTCDGMGIGLDNPTTCYNAMDNAGIWDTGNIIMDISHPYFWEEYQSMDPATTPEAAAQWYDSNVISPWVNLIGSTHCWIGETFAWYPNLTHDLQVRWITALVNVCLERGVGIQIWSYFGKQGWNDEALQASNYLD